MPAHFTRRQMHEFWEGVLQREGYASADRPDDADVILVNTCAVREKAEQKLLSALGRYRVHKARRGTLLAVAGCVAQQEKERLLKRVPYVDFVFGPDNIARLPEMVERARGGRFADTIVVVSSGRSTARHS